MLTVDELIGSFPKGSLEADERVVFSELWIEEYWATKGKKPSNYDLTKLADWLLADELGDTSRSKVQNNEYPILSKPQLERRYRELSMEQNMVDILHQKKIHNQPTKKKDAKNNEY